MKKILLIFGLLIGFNLIHSGEPEGSGSEGSGSESEQRKDSSKESALKAEAEKRNAEILKSQEQYQDLSKVVNEEMKKKEATGIQEILQKKALSILMAIKGKEKITIFAKADITNGTIEKIKKLFKENTFTQLLTKKGTTDMSKISSEFAKKIIKDVVFADEDHQDLKSLQIVMYEHPSQAGQFTVHFKDSSGINATLMTDLNGQVAHLVKDGNVSSYNLQGNGDMTKTKNFETETVVCKDFDPKNKYNNPDAYIEKKNGPEKK